MNLPSKPPKPTLLIGDSYNRALNQSIAGLLTEIRKGAPNLHHFADVFYELMQSQIDPPLETVWVYSALSFQSRNITKGDASSQFSISKELFQLVSGVTCSSSAAKSIALLAPVVFELHKSAVELLAKDLGAKRVKKGIAKIKSFIGEILGFMSVCCCSNLAEETDSNLIVPFKDLVSLWMNGEEELDLFLPLTSDEICREIGFGLCSTNYLVGVVIAEAFLLKLCLDLRVGDRGTDKEKELRSSAVGSITVLRSFHFFGTLVRMLLEPTLPLSSLLSSDDEILLRRVLYDAVILVEYPHVSPEITSRIPTEHVTDVAIERLILALEAIERSRKDGDHERAISFTSSFSSSRLPSQIIKIVTSRIGKGEAANDLKGSSPKAFLNWLLVQEREGHRLFDDRIAKHLARLPLDDFKTGYDRLPSELESKNGDVKLQLYIDHDGDENNRQEGEEKNESMISAFVAAAHGMRLMGDRGRKRKHVTDGKKGRIKLPKNDDVDGSDSDTERSSSPVSDNGSGSESDVENPISDEDI